MALHDRCDKCGKYEKSVMDNPHYPSLPDGWRRLVLHDEQRINMATPNEFVGTLCRACWPDVWATVTQQLKFRDVLPVKQA